MDDLIFEEDKHWSEKDVSFSILYPINRQEDVKRVWSDSMFPYKQKTVVLLIFLITLGAVYYINRSLLSAAFWIPLVILIAYNVFNYTYKNFDRAFKAIGTSKTKFLFSYFLGICTAFVFLIILHLRYNFFTVESLTIYGLGGGITLGSIIHKFWNTKD